MKKLLSLIIVLSMLAVMLVACSQAPEATNGEGTKDTVAATGTSADSNLDEWGRPLVESALPADLNFGGEVINIYCDRAHSADLSVEELNDDIINDAVYNRNIKVEEDLGVDLNWIFSDAAPATKAFAGEVDAIVFNSTGDYDIVMGYGYFLPCMVPVNTYSNLYNIPYLDFEKPWWNQIYVEQATLNGQMYTCVGDLSLSSTYGAGCIFFN